MFRSPSLSDSYGQRRAETEENVPRLSDALKRSVTFNHPALPERKMLPLRTQYSQAKLALAKLNPNPDIIYQRNRFAALAWLFALSYVLIVMTVEDLSLAVRLILASVSIFLVLVSIMVLWNFKHTGFNSWYYFWSKLGEFAACITLYKILPGNTEDFKLLLFLYAQVLCNKASKTCHALRIIMTTAALIETYSNQISYLILITTNIDVVMELAKPKFKKSKSFTDSKEEESTKEALPGDVDHKIAPIQSPEVGSASPTNQIPTPKISINMPKESSKSSEPLIALESQHNIPIPAPTTRRSPDHPNSKRNRSVKSGNISIALGAQALPFRMHSLQHPSPHLGQNQYLEPRSSDRRDHGSSGVHSELNISHLTFKDRQITNPAASPMNQNRSIKKGRQNSAVNMDESPHNEEQDNSFHRKAKELNRTISFKPLSSFGDFQGTVRTEIESK